MDQGKASLEAGLAFFPAALLLLAFPVLALGKAESQPLKLLISIEQQTITAPFPARVTLHLHNAGQGTLWLYRPVRSPEALRRGAARSVEATESQAAYTGGGSTLQVRLDPLQPSEIVTPAQGEALQSVGFPHPRLVRLNAGEDHEEKTVIQLRPALAGTREQSKAVWGAYRLAVIYGAKFSNGEESAKNLGAEVWQGEVTSNSIEVELLPPGAAARGSASGTVVGPSRHSLADVVVSLSDEQERLLGQLWTGPEARFSFTQLPLGLYWLTARVANSPTDTVVFRHVELAPDQPASGIELVMMPREIYEPKGMLHKPVLFRVRGAAGSPAAQVTLEITWSNGPVMDKIKGEVSDDGMVALELIPGRSFVTLKKRGCAKEEQRVDVAEGPGIDDFGLVLECARK